VEKLIFFVSDMFISDYVGGAELTSEAIIDKSLLPLKKIYAHHLTTEFMKKHQDKHWVFGNFTNVNESCLLYAAKNLNYSVLEYDYKYCINRSPEKHATVSGECNCHKERRGKLISIFYKKSKIVWFMSKQQMNHYVEKFPFLNNTRVLNSVFSEETLDYIESLDCGNKNKNWIILGSPSWIKGKDAAIKLANEKNLEYELVWGLEHKELLKKLASSKGLIYLPQGGDTCPRLVIEAKLLGCELLLNENVQHKNEQWFTDDNVLLPHLRERTYTFWSSVELLWNLNTPKPNAGEETAFNFIVPFYNAGPWIKKCIRSIKQQSYTNYRCFLIDDMSTDDSCDIVNKEINNDVRFELIKNKTKRFALGNIVRTIESNNTSGEDVNIILDGDDWLSSVHVLSHLNKIYRDEGCLITYGNYVYYPTGKKGTEPSPYPVEVIEKNAFRKDRWRASHLRTFKTKLWRHIDLKDLKDSNNNFYRTAYDQALMLPLLEIAGHRSKFVGEIMHVYNRSNPLNVDKIKQQEQFMTAQKIRTMTPYRRVF